MSKQEEKVKEEKTGREQILPPIIDDDGINLVPIMTKKEVVEERKKIKVNLTAVITIVLFLLITIGVVVFSTITKIQLNNKREELFELENEIKSQSSKILDNQELLKRIYLYRDISSSQFSTRQIFDYFTEITGKQGEVAISSFDFGLGTQHSFEGSADSLDTASKFWYLLQNDEKIESVRMNDFSKSQDRVKLSFNISLVDGAFAKEEEKEMESVEDTAELQEDSDDFWESYDEDLLLED